METDVDTTVVRKSMLVAHLLWLSLGWVGAHRFYLGKPHAWWMVVLFMLALAGPLRMFLIAALLVWWVADGIILAPWVRKINGEDERWAS